jgi:uncharacterized protein
MRFQAVTDSFYPSLADPEFRPRYRVDLAAYMRTCDRNFRRLLTLIPDLESSKEGRVWKHRLGDDLNVMFTLTESFPYTATLQVALANGRSAWPARLSMPVIDVRLYFDARTAEPVSYQGRRRIPARSAVPNADMYHQDEKRQINEFLAQWLQLCLASDADARPSSLLFID